LDQSAELHRLVQAASNAVAISLMDEARVEPARQQAVAQTPLAEMTRAELKTHFSEPRALLSKRERRGCEELIRLGQAAMADPGSLGLARNAGLRSGVSVDGPVQVPTRSSALPPGRALAEVARALKNDRRAPAPATVGSYALPFLILDYMHNPIGKGDSSRRISRQGAREPDRIDPPASSFWMPKDRWRRRIYITGSIAHLAQLESPFGLTPAEDQLRPLARLRSGLREARIKVKFGETKSEPFTARIFSALATTSNRRITPPG
jgi:hypothetical protein